MCTTYKPIWMVVTSSGRGASLRPPRWASFFLQQQRCRAPEAAHPLVRNSHGGLPSGKHTKLMKMAIYSGFSQLENGDFP